MAPKLRIRTCTWNVGNANLPEDISSWVLGTKSNQSTLGSEANKVRDLPDLIVVGIQECGNGMAIVDAKKKVVEENEGSGCNGAYKDPPTPATTFASDSASQVTATITQHQEEQPSSHRRILKRSPPHPDTPLPNNALSSVNKCCEGVAPHIVTPDKCSEANSSNRQPVKKGNNQGTPTRKGSAKFRMIAQAFKSVRMAPRPDSPSCSNSSRIKSNHTENILSPVLLDKKDDNSSRKYDGLVNVSSPPSTPTCGLTPPSRNGTASRVDGSKANEVKRNRSASPFFRGHHIARISTPKWVPFRTLTSDVGRSLSTPRRNLSLGIRNKFKEADSEASKIEGNRTAGISSRPHEASTSPKYRNTESVCDASSTVSNSPCNHPSVSRQLSLSTANGQSGGSSVSNKLQEGPSTDCSSQPASRLQSASSSAPSSSSSSSSSSPSPSSTSSSSSSSTSPADSPVNNSYPVRIQHPSSSDGSAHGEQHQINPREQATDRAAPETSNSPADKKKFKKKLLGTPKRMRSAGLISPSLPLRFYPKQKKLEKLVLSNLPSGYNILSSKWMWQMGLVIYVHEKAKHRILEEPKMLCETTGIGNVIGNKGAVWAKLTVDDGTKFCFVNSHLAAHEGEVFRQARVREVRYLMKSIGKSENLPFSQCFDHVFWLGDLNCRLNINCKTLRERLSMFRTLYHLGGRNGKDDVMRMKRTLEFANIDELTQAISNGLMFDGFQEGPIEFSPTFKVHRHDGRMLGPTRSAQMDDDGWLKIEEYQEKRVPAYCDRVIWKSNPLYSSHVRQRDYGSVNEYCTSDHKPVYALFDVFMPRQQVWMPFPVAPNALLSTVDLVSLKLQIHEEDDRLTTNSSADEPGAEDANGRSLRRKRSAVSLFDPFRMDRRNGERQEVRIFAKDAFVHDMGYTLQMKADTDESDSSPGRTWVCTSNDEHARLARIPVKGVRDMGDLRYKSINVCFRDGRWKKWKSGCTLALTSLLEGRHGEGENGASCWGNEVCRTLKVWKHGRVVGTVKAIVRLTVCTESHAQGRWVGWGGERVRGE